MNKFLILAVAGLLSFSLAGCAHKSKVQLNSAAMVPAASGHAEIGTDRNGNTTVAVRVANLARPASLTPPATAYVVWIEPRGEGANNVGTLKVNDNLDGSFSTTTPYKMFTLLVTAEGNPRTVSPLGPTIMKQDVTR